MIKTALFMAALMAQIGTVTPEGILIKTQDMAAMRSFYGETLELGTGISGEDWTRFDAAGDAVIYLVEAEEPGPAGGEEMAKAAIVFYTQDLQATRDRWAGEGVRFETDQPNTNGVGHDYRFLDPDGNSQSLIALAAEAARAEAEGTVIYNYGFSFTDITAARQLFTRTLGFEVMTERYFPPALPLNRQDGGFGFMLHEVPDLAPLDTVSAPDVAGVSLLFGTDDLDGLEAGLVEAGYSPLRLDRAGHEALWLEVAEGVAAEFWLGLSVAAD